ncbi:hypothetical protein N0B31_13050 [Salinirubellus salinus]|uniref:Uncharacterized protein n=1 Tax=Salinirubellus salinus TaxID=1364945 RepID=A0A9E7QZU3_9EURY|nr:hypothetical protein [Salinirubellus salinus]UWM53075.1 hypothetical protein N0B31_13050 [Salinirubellus salinus]
MFGAQLSRAAVTCLTLVLVTSLVAGPVGATLGDDGRTDFGDGDSPVSVDDGGVTLGGDGGVSLEPDGVSVGDEDIDLGDDSALPVGTEEVLGPVPFESLLADPRDLPVGSESTVDCAFPVRGDDVPLEAVPGPGQLPVQPNVTGVPTRSARRASTPTACRRAN